MKPWTFVALMVVALSIGIWAMALAPGHEADELQELRKAMAVQAVQLQDARDRIHALEVDMDHVAPHTIPRQP